MNYSLRTSLACAMVCCLSIAGTALADNVFTGSNAKWKAECGSCHVAYPAQLLPATSWQRLMKGLDKHFGTDASVDAGVDDLDEPFGPAAMAFEPGEAFGGGPASVAIHDDADVTRRHGIDGGDGRRGGHLAGECSTRLGRGNRESTLVGRDQDAGEAGLAGEFADFEEALHGQ